MSNDSDQTLKTVNASGFPLQIGIKAAVEKARGDHNWRVRAASSISFWSINRKHTFLSLSASE
jgi:hypothetical protein